MTDTCCARLPLSITPCEKTVAISQSGKASDQLVVTTK